MTRRLCYVSGTRADFGLMRRSLVTLANDPAIDLSLVVTGMHLTGAFGNTQDEIAKSGLEIVARIPVDITAGTGESMARAIAVELDGMTTVFRDVRPDAVLLLGDRGEMLAAAIAALHLNIPIIHIHGGERSGTVDEPVRHAISKLSHFHFVATEGARERLIRMGEREQHIFVTGAPGLDGIMEQANRDRMDLAQEFGFDPFARIALVLFHPVVQDVGRMASQIEAILDCTARASYVPLCFLPNADAGYPEIRDVMMARQSDGRVTTITHAERQTYLSLMATADLMIGNSSSGIIEAASFGLPVVNVGGRQNGRERSANVIDTVAEPAALDEAIARARVQKGRLFANVYGDGHASERIHKLILTLPLHQDVLNKSNAY